MMEWSKYYFWELFKLDALTILGFLGVLLSIPIGAFIGKRLRLFIESVANNNRDDR